MCQAGVGLWCTTLLAISESMEVNESVQGLRDLRCLTVDGRPFAGEEQLLP